MRTRIYERILEAEHRGLIEAAIIFGDEGPEPAMAVFVKASPKTNVDDKVVVDKVWETVESELNTKFPAPVQLAKNMILPIRNATLPRTPKGEVIRTLVIEKYRDLLDGRYKTT